MVARWKKLYIGCLVGVCDPLKLYIMSSNLWSSYHIMSSDEDQPVVEDLYAGFDDRMNLVVMIEHTDYVDPEYSCSVSAVVSKEDAFGLSRRLQVSMTRLPDAIGGFVEEYADIVNADFAQVQACFGEITARFIQEKCSYNIVRRYGKNGFVCC